MFLVNLIAVINILVLFVLLIFRKNNPLPNVILAFLFLIPGLYFIDNMIILKGLIYRVPYFFFTVQALANFFPVLTYVYVQLLLGKKLRFHPILMGGSLFLMVYIFYLTLDFEALTDSEKNNYLTGLTEEPYPESMLFYTIFFYAWQMVYFSVITIQIIQYTKRVQGTISSMDQLRLSYIKKFMILFWVFNLWLVVMYLVLPIYSVDYFWLPVIVNILYGFVIYYSYHHNTLFTQKSYSNYLNANKLVNESLQWEEEQSVSDSSTNKCEKIAQKIDHALRNEKIYRNINLTLTYLAEYIDEPTYLVSQTINQHFKRTFFDLVNEIRVQEAEDRLKKMAPGETVEAIALTAGFNSRPTFYRAFKKYTGKTPSEVIGSSS